MCFTKEDIKETAYQIYEERKQRGDADYDNADKNWDKAKERLVLLNFWHRG